MKNYLFLLFITSSLAMSSCNSKQAVSTSNTLLDPTEFLEQFKTNGGMLIDVRTPGEYSDGSIPSAINIDFKSADFESKISEINKSSNLYLYCRSGGRSAAACKKAKKLGFVNVYDMKGGYLAYSKSK